MSFSFLGARAADVYAGSKSASADTTASQPSNWKVSSLPSLKFSQLYYDNWASDGYTQVAFTIGYVGTYTYSAKNYIWDSRADLAFGFLKIDMNDDKIFDDSKYLRKSDDKIDLTSTFSLKMKHNWNCNASVNLKSQFYDSYKFYADPAQEPTLISTLFAPAYMLTSLGFEYKKTYWNASFSFITGKNTFVLDERINPADYGVNDGRSYMGWGSFVRFYFKKDVMKNVNLYTRVELFWEYQKKEIFRQTDVNWETTVTFNVNSWLSAFASLNIIYDTDYSLARQLYQRSGIQLNLDWKSVRRK
jgi:hypothetical protein